MKGLRLLVCVVLTLSVASLLLGPAGMAEELPVYKDPNASLEDRVADLVSRMTLEEKIAMLHGVTGRGATGYIPGNERLGIPPLQMEDGPVGVRRGEATAFPASIAMAATWNPDLIEKVGADIAAELKAKGRDVLLAPCVNILRVPQGGRSFEGYGEDPYLASRMTVAFIKGVQSQNAIATVKHYVANNQENQRFSISADVDERTLREIYLPAFKAAVKEAGVWSVMGAYNKVNGTYACENKEILTDILKNEWGFKGYVVSDWGACHSSVESALAGLDVEMPGGSHFGDSLLEAVRNGEVSEEVIDDKVSRVLRAMFAIGMFDQENQGYPIDVRGHAENALRTAQEGIVLLKNEGDLLPLDPATVDSVAVIGRPAADLPVGGGGSSRVSPFYTVDPVGEFAREFPVVYFAQGPAVSANALPPIPASALTPAGGREGQQGLRAEYFAYDRIRVNREELGTTDARNLLGNGGFTEGLFSTEDTGNSGSPNFDTQDNWILLLQDGVATASVENGMLRVDIENGGSNPWSVQLAQSPFRIERKGIYEIRFDARASKERTIEFKVGSAEPRGWTAYNPGNAQCGAVKVTIGTEMQAYEHVFVMSQETDPGARFEFQLGADNGTVWIDNVSVKKIGETESVGRFAGEPVMTRIDRQIGFDWEDGSPEGDVPADRFSVRWTGKLTPPVSGEYVIGTTSDDGIRVYLNGEVILEDWSDHAPRTETTTVNLEAGKAYDLKVEYYENGGGAVAQLGWIPPEQEELDPEITKAVEVAEKADVAVVFVRDEQTEGADHELTLPGRQAELVQAVVEANPNTVVVLNTGAPVLMKEWVEKVPAILEAWYPGEEGGRAIVDVLVGRVNPSGKLPVTFLKTWEDSPAYGNYPGEDGHVVYEEGVMVGYRHFDTKGIEPLFPFGHGLSYTTFSYANLQITPDETGGDTVVTVSLEVTNTGDVAGAEVVQLYVRDVKATVVRPDKELKRFGKVFLKPGETKTITFTLDRNALAFYDVEAQDWVVEPGEFEVLIGSSSRDIRLIGSFQVK